MTFRNELIEESNSGKLNFNIVCQAEEWQRARDLKERRLYLYGTILPIDCEDRESCNISMVSNLVENIMMFNRQDKNKPIADREPIILYINSPGGELTEGFALISAIELSKTPIFTVNVGQWSSMSFLIGITGHKRFSLPNMTFLLHDGSSFAAGSVNKMQDKMEFEKRFETEVVKKHVLSHSNMKNGDYDMLSRVEFYMLPEDALERGFIDEIVTDIDAIL